MFIGRRKYFLCRMDVWERDWAQTMSLSPGLSGAAGHCWGHLCGQQRPGVCRRLQWRHLSQVPREDGAGTHSDHSGTHPVLCYPKLWRMLFCFSHVRLSPPCRLACTVVAVGQRVIQHALAEGLLVVRQVGGVGGRGYLGCLYMYIRCVGGAISVNLASCK